MAVQVNVGLARQQRDLHAVAGGSLGDLVPLMGDELAAGAADSVRDERVPVAAVLGLPVLGAGRTVRADSALPLLPRQGFRPIEVGPSAVPTEEGAVRDPPPVAQLQLGAQSRVSA